MDFKTLTNSLDRRLVEYFTETREKYDQNLLFNILRDINLQVIDKLRVAHIDDMQELKRGINLRSYGQKNPVVEYRYEGFEMFDAMVESIREETVRMLMTIQVQQQQPAPQRQQVLRPYAPNAGSPESKKTDLNKTFFALFDIFCYQIAFFCSFGSIFFTLSVTHLQKRSGFMLPNTDFYSIW